MKDNEKLKNSEVSDIKIKNYNKKNMIKKVKLHNSKNNKNKNIREKLESKNKNFNTKYSSLKKGICHILSTFNNTIITFTDLRGNTISWSSSGKCNFRGSRKSTSYAAQIVAQDAGKKALSKGFGNIEVYIRGIGMGRDASIKTIQSIGMTIKKIKDVTPIPHNGCRPKKKRRV
jgi:small subunit ribosomal protein S11